MDTDNVFVKYSSPPPPPARPWNHTKRLYYISSTFWILICQFLYYNLDIDRFGGGIRFYVTDIYLVKGRC